MANALKEIPTFLPNKSIILNKPEEFLKENYASDESRNTEFYNEELRGRLGLTKFDTTPLNGAILLTDQFWKYDGTWFFIIATTTDIYKYDFNALTYDVLTPLLTGTGESGEGGITIGSSGYTNFEVIGSGVDFVAEGIKTGDFIKIGNSNPTAKDVWYEIATVDSTIKLTLTTEFIPESGEGYPTESAFTIRKCFTGDTSDQWHSVTFQDAILGEQWIATNGVDTPIRYGGTGQVTPLTSLPTGFVSAKYIDVYKDRIIFLNTVETGSQPQRERWSGIANCESWDDLDFLDFIEGGYWITGSLVWNGYHIVFRERDALVGRWVGGTAVFSYEGASSCSGVWAPNSICATVSKIFYYGPDSRFHDWNLITENDLTDPIAPYINNLDPNLDSQIYGYEVETKSQIRWFVPYGNPTYLNSTIVWDYLNENLYIWEYEQEQACCSIGEYVNSTDVYMDDSVWGELYIDEQEGFWDDRTFLNGAPVLVYGGYDGYLRNADIGFTDDGTNYNRIFESVRQNFKSPNQIKRLWKQQHWLKSDTVGDVTISIKTDDNNEYRTDTKTISLIDSTRDIIKKNITWDKHAENFKTRIEADNHFSILGWINYIFLKGNTGR